MIPLPAYQGSTVGVVGLGKTGLAAVKALEAAGAHVAVWDDKLGETGVSPVGLTPLDAWPWDELLALVMSPGVPLTHPAPHAAVLAAKAKDIPVIGDIELLLTACPDATAIGITGTNGKSTTTALVAHILKQAGRDIEVGGNLGMPVLSMRALGKEGIYVLELSSYQIELMHDARVHVAALLNVTPDHLDRHGGMDGYLAAKRRLFDLQRDGDAAIVAIDDGHTEAVARELLAAGRTVIPVSVTQGVNGGVFVRNGVLHDTESRPERLIDLAPCLALKGEHNGQNAAVAYAICRRVGVDPGVIEAGMKSFPGLAHRMERVGAKDGVTFVNDSKATNAEAAARALGAYDHLYWIAGGQPKAGGIESLGAFFPKMRGAYLIGEAEAAFAATLDGHVETHRCGTLEAATRQAAADAFASGGYACVMLSPACASWDQWPNFEARGDAFRALAAQLIAQRP